MKNCCEKCRQIAYSPWRLVCGRFNCACHKPPEPPCCSKCFATTGSRCQTLTCLVNYKGCCHLSKSERQDLIIEDIDKALPEPLELVEGKLLEHPKGYLCYDIDCKCKPTPSQTNYFDKSSTAQCLKCGTDYNGSHTCPSQPACNECGGLVYKGETYELGGKEYCSVECWQAPSQIEMVSGHKKDCELVAKIKDMAVCTCSQIDEPLEKFGSDIGEILADFETDKNEEKAVNALYNYCLEALNSQKSSYIKAVKEMLKSGPSRPYESWDDSSFLMGFDHALTDILALLNEHE